jgi:hypothetical protein
VEAVPKLKFWNNFLGFILYKSLVILTRGAGILLIMDLPLVEREHTQIVLGFTGTSGRAGELGIFLENSADGMIGLFSTYFPLGKHRLYALKILIFSLGIMSFISFPA